MNRYTIRLKRGNYNKMPDKFEVGEPFYLLDMNIMGIGDANGNPSY